jgi:CHAT domain-containing protein
VADTDISRATVLVRIGDYERAERVARRALAAYQQVDEAEGVARAHGTIGLVLSKMDRLEEAAAAYETCREQSLAIGDELDAAKALNGLGAVHGFAGDPRRAIEELRESLTVFEDLRDFRAEMDTLYFIAFFQEALGKHREARKGYQDVFRLADQYDVAETLIDAGVSLAEMELGRGRNAAAMREARRTVEVMNRTVRGLGQEQGAKARAPRGRLFQIGVEAAAAIQDASSFSWFLECGRAGALLETLEAREAIRSASVPEALRDREEQARTAEATARRRLQDARESGHLDEIRARRTELLRAQDAVQAAVDAIQRSAKASAELLYPEPVSLDEIREGLAPGDALVQYAFVGEKAYALVATTRAARVVSLGAASEIESQAADAAELLARRDGALDEILAPLRDLLIRPLKLRAEVRRLLVLPDGHLYQVPLRALTPDYETTYVPSGTTMHRLRARAGGRGEGVLALGDPEYDYEGLPGPFLASRSEKLSPLPETREEVEAIGTQTLLGREASKTGLRQALEAHGRWRAVHLACHGVVDPLHPMRSALAITPAGDDDGFLTALEVLHMRIEADLAVLSACDSGRGKLYHGEGLVGLTRAFMLAGSPQLLVSLWKVDDAATRALMVEFYELWNPRDGSEGLRASEALQQAQAHVRAQEGWEHPYYWAAWVLWGLPE